MTRHQCKWILIGLLITFFDFRLNSFNLVPDLAGWIIIIVQLGNAEEKYQSYKTARTMAVILLAISIPDLFTEMDVFSLGSLYYLLTLSTSILYLWFVWKLLEGMALQLEEQNAQQKAQSIWSFRKIYAIVNIIVICFSALVGISQEMRGLFLNLWGIPVIATLILQILLFVKIYDTGKVIEDNNQIPA